MIRPSQCLACRSLGSKRAPGQAQSSRPSWACRRGPRLRPCAHLGPEPVALFRRSAPCARSTVNHETTKDGDGLHRRRRLASVLLTSISTADEGSPPYDYKTYILCISGRFVRRGSIGSAGARRHRRHAHATPPSHHHADTPKRQFPSTKPPPQKAWCGCPRPLRN